MDTPSQMLAKLKSKRSKRSRSASQEEARKDDDITKHYPWLQAFDNEAKARLTEPEVSNVNVVKLMTMLESHVSPEVTKLRNKPNRATKFLGQVNRRVSMVKMGGYMMERECELQLFPTYGLLMAHIVNITLISSKVEKYGAQQVAQDLYYFLKLMFQEDNEYILDVVLCSTLDEHATSDHKVGFQLFSFIVEDWRCYNNTHSVLMKYCAVANLLSEGSTEGRVFVERCCVPADIDKNFPKFIARTLMTGSEGMIKKKLPNLKAVIQSIKVTRVKSVSRNRLVVVSKKDITRITTRELSSEISDADSSRSDSSNSTLVHQPNRNSQDTISTDPLVNSFFSEIGIGNFSLDTSGHQNALEEGGANTGYSYDLAREHLESTSEDCLVTSSTVRRSGSLRNNKTEPTYSYSNSDHEMEIDEEDYDDGYEGDLNNSSPRGGRGNENISRGKGKSPGSRSKNSVDEGQEMRELVEGSSLEDRDSLESGDRGSNGGDSHDRDSENDQQLDQNKDSMKYTPMSDHEQNGNSDPEDLDYDDDANLPKSPTLSEAPAIPAALKKNAIVDDDDSDLEILSEKAISKHGDDSDDNASTGSGSRDEAEPESGEDYVPNYDVDSDEEVDEEVDDEVETPGEVEVSEGKNNNKNNDIVTSEKTSINEDQEPQQPPPEENESTTGTDILSPAPVKSTPEIDSVAPSSTKKETEQDKKEEQKLEDENEASSSVISLPSRSLRKSVRTPVVKSNEKATGTSTPSGDRKEKAKSKSSKGAPPKRMKLNSESEEDDNADEDMVSQSSTQSSLPSSSRFARGKKLVSTPKAPTLQIGVSTRRSTRSTRSVTPLLLTSSNTPTPPVTTTRRGRGRGTPVVETEPKEAPVTLRSRLPAGRGIRGRPFTRK